jgi:hypothetical protein
MIYVFFLTSGVSCLACRSGGSQNKLTTPRGGKSGESLKRTITMNTDNAVADPVTTQYAEFMDSLIARCNQLEQANAELTAQRDVAIAERDIAQANAIRTVAPWHVEVRNQRDGRFTYNVGVPGMVSVTTDVDLRQVHDYGIGGDGHRYFWYRTSEDGEYHQLPMQLTAVSREPGVSSFLNMRDNADGSIVFDGGTEQMYRGEHNLSADLRHHWSNEADMY